jgi:hypothetical protein
LSIYEAGDGVKRKIATPYLNRHIGSKDGGNKNSHFSSSFNREDNNSRRKESPASSHHFPFALLRKTISRKGAKAALNCRNDDQSPIDKLVSGPQD